jgi:hypothetical protein
MKNLFLSALLLTTLTAAATAQMEPPKPQAEHKKLTAYAGTWHAAIEMMGEDGKPQKSEGKSVLEVGPGGLWVVDKFEATMMGGPFSGLGTTGYDPTTKKYVGTWHDSWSTTVMHTEGTYDTAGKVLTMTGMGQGPDGKPVQHLLVTTDKDANTRVFEMYGPGPDGKEMKYLTITYTRQAAKGADKK